MESQKQLAKVIPFRRPVKVEASRYNQRFAQAAYEAAARASYLLHPRVRAATQTAAAAAGAAK